MAESINFSDRKYRKFLRDHKMKMEAKRLREDLSPEIVIEELEATYRPNLDAGDSEITENDLNKANVSIFKPRRFYERGFN
jgi:hypothetical protein